MDRETFLEILTNHTPKEINEIIEQKGKRKLMNALISIEEDENEGKENWWANSCPFYGM